GANATIDCPATPVFTAPTATDNCDPAPSVVEVSDLTTSGTCANTYTRTKTWKAVDVCGNESGTVSQTITVQDITAPVITSCPGPKLLNCCDPTDPDQSGTATATDNCSTPVISYNDVTNAGNCALNYVITRTWTATDACGNHSSCEQTITVTCSLDIVV